jgi:hypothetical protein
MWERDRTCDRVLARFSMPALENIHDISLKAKSVRLFLIFIANGHRISRSWPEIENSPNRKNAGESSITI